MAVNLGHVIIILTMAAFAVQTVSLNKCPRNLNLINNRFLAGNSFRLFPERMALEGCYNECRHRQRCKSFNFYQHHKFCQLNSVGVSSEEELHVRPGVLYSQKANWTQVSEPAVCSQCRAGQTCNPDGDPVCTIQECEPLPLIPANSVSRGNVFAVGAKVSYGCTLRHRRLGTSTSITCLGTGTWTPTGVRCISIVGSLSNPCTGECDDPNAECTGNPLQCSCKTIYIDIAGICVPDPDKDLVQFLIPSSPTQSSTEGDLEARRAVDGLVDWPYCSRTSAQHGGIAWFRLTFNRRYTIHLIVIAPRKDYAYLLQEVRVDVDKTLCAQFAGPGVEDTSAELRCHDGPREAQEILIVKDNLNILEICEIKIFGV